MSLRTLVLAAPIALVLAASFASAQSGGLARVFSTQADAQIKESLESKRGLTFHLSGGQSIGGAVKEIGSDFILVANQENSRILIRLSSIDAVAGN